MLSDALKVKEKIIAMATIHSIAAETPGNTNSANTVMNRSTSAPAVQSRSQKPYTHNIALHSGRCFACKAAHGRTRLSLGTCGRPAPVRNAGTSHSIVGGTKKAMGNVHLNHEAAHTKRMQKVIASMKGSHAALHMHAFRETAAVLTHVCLNMLVSHWTAAVLVLHCGQQLLGSISNIQCGGNRKGGPTTANRGTKDGMTSHKHGQPLAARRGIARRSRSAICMGKP